MLSHLLLATLDQTNFSLFRSQFCFMLVSFDWRGSSFFNLSPDVCFYILLLRWDARRAAASVSICSSQGEVKSIDLYRRVKWWDFFSCFEIPITCGFIWLKDRARTWTCHRNGAGGVKEVVEKRRSHNDNDPGHVFLRWDNMSIMWTTIKMELQCTWQN